MGQRLVVHMMHENKEIANCYYHWSAYTSSSLEVVKQIMEAFTDELTESCKINGVLDNRLLAIRLLEKTGAGVYSKDAENVLTLYPGLSFAEGNNRNEGLISFSEEEMANSNNWSEGDVYIYMDTNIIDFQVIWEMDDDSIAEYALEDVDEDEIDENQRKVLIYEYKKQFPELKLKGYSMDHIPFDKFMDFYEAMENCPSDFSILGSYYTMIE